MSDTTVRFTVFCTIHEGKLAEFEEAALAMIAASRLEPGTIGYEWHLSADRSQCRLLESYAGPEAVVAHMTGPAVRDLVPKALAVASIDRFEVYGDPGPEGWVLLAGFGASIYTLWHGLGR